MKKKTKVRAKTNEADNLKRIVRAKLTATKDRFERSDYHRALAKAARDNYGQTDPSRRKR
jgi:hypothetical protein